MTALDNAIAAMPAQAKAALAKVVEQGAQCMVQEPWRILRALYPFAPRTWPSDKSLVEMLTDCRSLIRAEVELGCSRGWQYDMNRHIGLLQSEEALTRIIAATAPAIEDAARRVA